MKLKATCPRCDRSFTIAPKYAGKSVKCPACQATFRCKPVEVLPEKGDDSALDSGPVSMGPANEAVAHPVGDARTYAAKVVSQSGAAQASNDASSSHNRSGQTSADSPSASTVNNSVTIGRFEIETKLGAGGFGDVYRVYDPLLDRQAALKVLRAGATNTQRKEKMLSEAKASARLRHPNIVAVYEVGEDQDRPFIASQFIAGDTLSKHIKDQDRPLTDLDKTRQLITWLIELCRALAYAHRESIVHRDVKPHNVLIDENSHAQLADFGLAHQMNPDAASPAQRQLVGTPAYMSPEQVDGDLSKVGPASDQYAVGVTLFEGLTGQKPFKGDSVSLLSAITHDEVPKPSQINANIARPLEQICLKTMSHQAEDRYADCDQLADDLQRWLDGELVQASNPSLINHWVHWAKKRPHLAGWLAAAAAILLLLGGTTATVTVMKMVAAQSDLNASQDALEQSELELNQVRLESEQLGLDLEEQLGRQRTIDYARMLDAGSHATAPSDLARIHRTLDRVPWMERGIEHSLIRRRVMGTPLILHAGEPIKHLSWSHDGSLLAAVTQNGNLHFWDGIHHTPLTVLGSGDIAMAEFHPSTSELVTLYDPKYDAKTRKTAPGTLVRWKVERLTNQVLLKRFSESKTSIGISQSLAFNPDGQRVAVCGSGGVEIRRWQNMLPLESKPKNVVGQVYAAAYSADGMWLACLTRSGIKNEIFVVDAANPDGMQPPSNTFHAMSQSTHPNLVCQSIQSLSGQALPSFKYFGGKVLGLNGAPVPANASGQPTCAIELAANLYFLGYADGHVMLGPTARVGHMAAITAAARRPDLACVASGDRSGEIRIWPTSSQTPEGARCKLSSPGKLLQRHRLTANGDGQLLSASNSQTPVVNVWRTEDGTVAFELDGHDQGTLAVQFHPQRNEVLTVDGTGVFRMWDLKPGPQAPRVLRSWKLDAEIPKVVRFDATGERILIAGSLGDAKIESPTGFARIVSAADGSTAAEINEFTGIPIAGVYVPAVEEVVLSCDDRSLARYSAQTGQQLAQYATNDLVALDLDATSDRLVAVLAEPCALQPQSTIYRSHLRCWQIDLGETLYDAGEPGLSYRYVDVDADLNRVLVPAGDGYHLLDLATGERLWTDERFPATRYKTVTKIVTKSVPSQVAKTQEYTVEVPYTEMLTEMVTVEEPVMKRAVLQGTRDPNDPNTIVGALRELETALRDKIVQGEVRRTKCSDGGQLLDNEQLLRGVYLKADPQGNLQLFADSKRERPLKLSPIGKDEETVALEIKYIGSEQVQRPRNLSVTKTKKETRTRQYTVTVCHFVPVEMTIDEVDTDPRSSAVGGAIFLPGGRGVALGQPDAMYVISAVIPSNPRELVASECQYQMLAANASGTLIAAAGKSGSCGACGCNDIDIWQTSDGQLLRSICLPGASAGDIAFDPRTGNLLVGLACFGGPKQTTAPTSDSPPQPVPDKGSNAPSSADTQATLQVFDPKSGELLQEIMGPKSVARIVTSQDKASPVVMVADAENRVHLLTHGVLTALPIRCKAANTVCLSPDGRMLVYQALGGHSVVALVESPGRQLRLPAPWRHAQFSLNGGYLVAKMAAQASLKQELLTKSWRTDRLLTMLRTSRPNNDLPAGSQSTEAWLLPGMNTTIVEAASGTGGTWPLHTHASLKGYHSNRPAAQPIRRGQYVFSIGDPYRVDSRQLDHNHVVIWNRNKSPNYSLAAWLTASEQKLVAWVRSIGGEATILRYPQLELKIRIPPSATFTEVDLARFHDLPNLTSLIVANGFTDYKLRGSHVSDKAILTMSSLPRLGVLTLGGNGITDQGMRHLSGFPIRELTVFQATVSSVGLNHFKQHRLKKLRLNGCKEFSEVGLEKSVVANAEEIVVRATAVSNAFLDLLSPSQGLRVLNLASTNVRSDSCARISQHLGLECLTIAWLGLTDRDVGQIANLKNLQQIDVVGNRITKESVQYIARTFPSLKDLNISHNRRIDLREPIDWSGLQNLEHLHAPDIQLSDAQLLAISEMKKLALLANDGIKPGKRVFSIQALEKFAERLPECMLGSEEPQAIIERLRR